MNKSKKKNCAKRKKPDIEDNTLFDFHKAKLTYSDRKQNRSPGAGELATKQKLVVMEMI